MKKYIRDIMNDLKQTTRPIKQRLVAPPVVPEDLDNQILSNNPLERVRQLDQQAQESEERQTLG